MRVACVINTTGSVGGLIGWDLNERSEEGGKRGRKEERRDRIRVVKNLSKI
jgi:hypothetical protein